MHRRQRSNPTTILYAALSAIALTLPTVAGCGGGLAPVTGTVTVDGTPLRGGNDVRATVVFQPASGGGAAAVGLVDENGQYTLSSGSSEGVAPGDYVVTITATQLIRSKDGSAAGGRRISDPKYANAKTSGFQCKVEPGGTQFDLALSSPSKSGSARGF